MRTVAKWRRQQRAQITDRRKRLERDHGPELDAMPPADVERLEHYLFGSAESGELGRRCAPQLHRFAMLSALAAGRDHHHA